MSWMSHGPPMKHSFAWMVTLTSKLSHCGPMESLRLTVARSVHPGRVTARCALLSIGTRGPVFIDGTGTHGVCLSLLSDQSLSLP